jgi:hypothetical protein
MDSESFVVLAQAPNLSLLEARDVNARAHLFDFARRRFLSRYRAEISDDSQTLIGAFDGTGKLMAVFGLRDERSGLFSQHYLAESLHEALARHFRSDIRPRDLVEVTHLCADGPGFLRQLVALLPGVLTQRGYRYLVCTATECLARFFARQGLPSVTLGTATAEALPLAERERWGAYYASRPRVLAGDLISARDQLTSRRAADTVSSV